MSNFKKTLQRIGYSEIGRWCNVSRQAVFQWGEKGKLPKSDNLPDGHADKTHYGAIIAMAAGITEEELFNVKAK